MHMMHVRVQKKNACVPFGTHVLHVVHDNHVTHFSFNVQEFTRKITMIGI